MLQYSLLSQSLLNYFKFLAEVQRETASATLGINFGAHSMMDEGGIDSGKQTQTATLMIAVH